MSNRNIAMVLGAVLAVTACFSEVSAQQTEKIIWAENGINVWSTPVDAPNEGLLAARVWLEATGDAEIVTFESINITGDVSQAHIPGFGGPTPTALAENLSGALDVWAPYDSHLLIPSGDVGGGADGALIPGIMERNDGVDRANQGPRVPLLQGQPPVVGIGDIFSSPTTAFFLGQTNAATGADVNKKMVDLAYLVIPNEVGDDGVLTANAFLSMGLLGEGFDKIVYDQVPVFEAIPEPATGLMAVMLGVGVLMYRRRRNR